MLSRDVKAAREWTERLRHGQIDKSGKPSRSGMSRVRPNTTAL